MVSAHRLGRLIFLFYGGLNKILKMMDSSTIHSANITIHVICGSIALLLGIIVLVTQKGKRVHKKIGRLFLWFLTIVVLTGLLGAIVFRGNSYLLVLTVLSGYNGFSGFRVIKTKCNTPKLLDISVALLSLSIGLYFLDYIKSKELFWNPIVVYSTFVALFLVVSYDLIRYLIPSISYKNLWLYEHIYKMINAFTALLAAAVGTVLPNYQPYSQLLPSVFGTLLVVGFILYFFRIRNAVRPNTQKIPENQGLAK